MMCPTLNAAHNYPPLMNMTGKRPAHSCRTPFPSRSEEIKSTLVSYPLYRSQCPAQPSSSSACTAPSQAGSDASEGQYYVQALLHIIRSLEYAYSFDNHVLLEFAMAHNFYFESNTGNHVDSILDHLLNGKCFSTANPGVACKFSRSMFADVKDLVQKVCQEIIKNANDIKYLLQVCKLLGMTESELKCTKTADECKTFLRLWCSDFNACRNVEEVLIRCEEMSASELLVTCRAHNILTTTHTKTHIDNLRAQLVSHLLVQDTEGTSAPPIAPSPTGPCCTSSPADLPYLIQKVIIDLCERPQVKLTLRRILTSLGIAIARSESLTEIRKKAKEYLRKARKAKHPLPVSTHAKRRRREAYRSSKEEALQLIRDTWPQKASSSLKGCILKKVRSLTSALALQRFPCAVCAEDKTGDQYPEQMTPFSQANLESLRMSYPGRMPNPFRDHPLLSNFILCPEGVTHVDEPDPQLRICKKCSNTLHNSNKVPLFALANGLLVGDIPECLKCLTIVEEACISLRHGRCYIIHLNGDSNLHSSPMSQRGLRGHVIIYPKRVGCMANVLPPPIDDVITPMCVLFVGSSPPTKEWLLKSAKPLIIRREKVRQALVWLKENNPLYKDVCIDHDTLDTYEHEFVAPVHIIVRDAEEDDNANGSTNGPSQTHCQLPEGIELAFDSAIVSDLQGREVTPHMMSMHALQHLKSGGGFVQIPHDSDPTNTYDDHDAFPAMFPTLFPYGVYGFEKPEQPIKMTMALHAKHLLALADTRFQEHTTFQFMVYNILQRREVNKSARFKINKKHVDSFAKDINAISPATIAAMVKRAEDGGYIQATTPEEKVVMSLMDKVKKINCTVDGTAASKVAMRNKIRAMMMQLGMPSFYITINPADVYSPILKFMSGEDIDVDNLLAHQVPKYFEQAKLVARNPVLASRFFHITMESFFDGVLNYSSDHDPNQMGLFGLTKGYFGCVEAQGRGTLHCHLFVWLEGGLNPQEIRERVQDEEFTTRLCDYIDDCIQNQIPDLPSDPPNHPLADAHPCAIRGPPITDTQSFLNSTEAQTDLHHLALACQKHVHAETCYKYWKGLHEKKECRFNLDPSLHVEKTTIDLDTGEIDFRISDGMVNNFCETILLAMRCNIDIKFIGSGQSAKAVLYYITDYITKSQLKAHTAYSALKTAVLKLRAEENDTEEDDYAYKAKRLLVKCANSLISKQELSAPQVAAYLMGYGDHYTSHTFRHLHLPSFQAYITDHMPKAIEIGDFPSEEPLPMNSIDDGHAHSYESTEHDIDSETDDREMEDVEDDSIHEDDEPLYDEVLLSTSSKGHIRAIQNDVTDYVMRGEDDAEIDVWSFISMFDKLAIKNDKSCSDNQRPNHPQGRPANRRSRFLPCHPDFATHVLRERCATNYYVPVPTCAIPNAALDANKEKHAMQMLILFKPWRSVADLLGNHTSWLDAYNDFLTDVAPEKLKVINNMQLLHECKTERDKDFANKGAKRRNLLRSLDTHSGERNAVNGTLDDFLGEDEHVVERLKDLKRAENPRRSKERQDQQEAVEAARAHGLYTNPYEEQTIQDHMQIDDDRVNSHHLVEDQGRMEEIWRETYNSRRTEFKNSLKLTRSTLPGSADENEQFHHSTHVPTSLPITISSIDLAHSSSSHTIDIGDTSSLTNAYNEKLRLVTDISLSFTLNKEQDRAFRSVAMHAIQDKPCCPLNLLISGPGGTGKSRVIDALKAFFSAIGQGRRFRLSSYTGVAAKNIKGMTLHTLLSLNQLSKENCNTSTTEAELFEMWCGVEYLFIDEVSMIGSELLTKISAALSVAKANPAPFGGISVIYAGDFCQLPPVANTRLYTPVENRSLPYSALNKKSQKQLLGRSAWLSCDNVVTLHQQMRQKGTENNRFRELLGRLRFGRCNASDVKLLNSRILGNADADLTQDVWQFAPIITKGNHVKDALNENGAEAFAARFGREIHYYLAQDYRSKKRVSSQLQEELYTYHSGQTSHAVSRLPLVEGMPVIFTQNYDVAGGVVNGTIGTLKSVRYTIDENGDRYAQSCVVEVPDLECKPMDGLQNKEVVALVEDHEFTITDYRTKEKATFKRKQLPIQPAFAMTDYKSQGRTLDYVIVDLTGCTGSQSPYVMISRATSLKGLLILRPFHPSKVQSHPSQDLRNEMSRIEEIHRRTETLFLQDLHLCRSDPLHPINGNLLKKLAPDSLAATAETFDSSTGRAPVIGQTADSPTTASTTLGPNRGRKSTPEVRTETSEDVNASIMDCRNPSSAHTFPPSHSSVTPVRYSLTFSFTRTHKDIPFHYLLQLQFRGHMPSAEPDNAQSNVKHPFIPNHSAPKTHIIQSAHQAADSTIPIPGISSQTSASDPRSLSILSHIPDPPRTIPPHALSATNIEPPVTHTLESDDRESFDSCSNVETRRRPAKRTVCWTEPLNSESFAVRPSQGGQSGTTPDPLSNPSSMLIHSAGTDAPVKKRKLQR